MELDLRKPLIALVLVIGLIAFIRSRYTFDDVLEYSKAHPHPTYSPMAEYYVGMAYYMRSDYPNCVKAFDQLLACTTCHPYGPKGLLRLGTCHEEQNHWAEARAAYERYFEFYPEGREKGMIQSKYDFIKFK